MVTFVPQPNAPQIVRSGSHLFIAVPPEGQVVYLPPFCVKCGQPATDKPIVKRFSWHHPALYLLVLVALLIYVIVALVVRKTVRVGVPLCARHAQRRKVWITLAWALPVAGIADAFVLPRLFDLDPGWIALLVVIFILAGVIIWAVAGNPIRPQSIDSFSAEFSGFCEPFLEQIPAHTRF
jgi:hypothetical protein